jgi:N-acetylated-alpha-linked acidic dipeptidase
VASTDEGFGFTSTDAIYHYHSIYDSQHWQEVYGDVGFHRHVSRRMIFCVSCTSYKVQVAVAKHLGLVGLRLADAIILPLDTTQYATELGHYLDK